MWVSPTFCERGETNRTGWCGTSMATPAVAGVATLAIEHYRKVVDNAVVRPPNALMKVWLIHSARDLGLDGPDYIYGYGEVDAVAVMDLISDTDKYKTDTIGANGEIDTLVYVVPPGASDFRVSLAWDDYAASPIISDGAPAVVNDLDLEVVAPDGSTTHYPFSLDPANPERAATATGANSRDNQEQVIVNNPTPGVWTIHVKGTTVPQAPQDYALVYTHGDILTCGSNLINNGGFESGTAGWIIDAVGAPASVVAAPSGGSGNALRLGSAVSDPDGAAQLVTIPATATIATLSFDWHVTSAEADPDAPFDTFTAGVAPSSNPSGLLMVGDRRSNAWKRNVWYGNQNIDVSAYAGQTVGISFGGNNDSLFVTSFYVDNVTLYTCTSTPVSNLATVAVDKTAAPTVSAGQTLTYTISVTNMGDVVATNIMITDTVPASTTLVLGSLSGDAAASGTTPGSLITWNTGATLAQNQSLSRTFVVTVADELADGNQITNTAYALAANAATSNDSIKTTITVGSTNIYLPIILK